jgi:hypothetical protein
MEMFGIAIVLLIVAGIGIAIYRRKSKPSSPSSGSGGNGHTPPKRMR